MLCNIKQLFEKATPNSTKKLIVAAADDFDVLTAVYQAYKLKLITPVLVGNKSKILSVLDKNSYHIPNVEIHHTNDYISACNIAISLHCEDINTLLTKGIVATNILLKQYFQNEHIKKNNFFLSHIAITEIPDTEKLTFFTDAALNIQPSFEQKISILKNALGIMHKLGYKKPKVAIICPSEMVNTKIESTIHASMLNIMGKRGQLADCEIDGPLALDNALNAKAATHKGIVSGVAGNADLLLFPNIDAGNVFYKTISILYNAPTAAVIIGGFTPIVLTSRADSVANKLASIALAVALA